MTNNHQDQAVSLRGTCIICAEEDEIQNLTELKDEQSWATLYNAAQIRNFKPLLDITFHPSETKVIYHRPCRQRFTHKKDLDKIKEKPLEDVETSARRSSRGGRFAAPVLPNECIFCQKVKYVKGSRTREKMKDCSEFRADEKVRNAARLHAKECSEKMEVASRIIGICSKDLISSEAKYHGSCYRDFVRIVYKQQGTLASHSCTNTSDEADRERRIEDAAFDKVTDFCEELISKPKVVEFTDISRLMTEEVNRLGGKLCDTSRKNLMRKVSNTFVELRFVSMSIKKVLVYPCTMEIDSLIKENFLLRRELEILSSVGGEEETVIKAAKILRKDILVNSQRLPWPPSAADLEPDKVSLYIPSHLDAFYNTILSGSMNVSDSSRVLTLKNSYAQDVVYSVSRGAIRTPKSVLLPSVIKALCNNTEVIRLISQHGHGVSYDVIEELDTEHALQVINKQRDGKVIIPDNIPRADEADQEVALVVSDNIDNLESTLSGSGTSHRVNSIIIWKTAAGIPVAEVDQDDDDNEPGPKRRRMLPTCLIMQDIPEYHGGQRTGPGELQKVHNLEIRTDDKKHRRQKLQYLIWLSSRRLISHPTLLVPGWTGFNITVRNNIVVVKSLIGYLDTIDSPATDAKTAYEVLCRGCAVRDKLNLAAVVCVFDQAFYAKAIEIFWKNKEKFKGLVLMLGGFHLLMMLLGTIGVRFGDAGLKEIAIQGGIVAEGSLDRTLAGKNYNRAIRLHKVVYEAMMRLLLDTFDSSISSDNERDILHQHDKVIEELKLNMCQEKYISVLESTELEEWHSLFQEYLSTIERSGGDLVKFWMSYLELCELTLNLIFATRTGDWDLYVTCIAEVIPWAFAYDRQNYAKYMIPFLNDMRDLPTSMPAVHNAFLNGEFAVQMSETNTFGGNEADKAIENTINRDCKTSGGYIGFSVNFSATQRWVLNATRRGEYKRILREHLAIKPQLYVHKELAPSQIQNGIKVVERVVDVLEGVLRNPWLGGELTSLSTGIEASGNVLDHLLNAKKYGMDACKNFVSSRCSSDPTVEFFGPLRKLKLKTFKDVTHKVKVVTKGKIIPLKLDRTLFARMALLGQYRKIDLKLVFTFPLGPLPWSLADAYSLPRKTNKAQLLNFLEKGVPVMERYPQNATSVYDGMAVLQKFRPPAGATFHVLALKIFEIVMSNPCNRVDVVFDVYREISIKNAERGKRSESTSLTSGTIYKNILPGYPIKSWHNFLLHSSNKTEVVKFLFSEWQTGEFLEKLGDRVLFVTSGTACLKLCSSGVEPAPELSSTHEEADTRMILHAMHASQTKKPVVIHADDTDVFILLLAHNSSLKGKMFMKVGKGTKRRIIQIDAIINKIKNTCKEVNVKDLLKSLIGLHAITGCDAVSSFCGKGKLKPLKLVMKTPKYVKALKEIGNSWNVPDDTFTVIEEMVCHMYGKKMVDVNLLRYQLHCATGGKVEPEALPPCQSSLKLHVQRGNYQAAIWRRALVACPEIPTPHGQGWEIKGADISIKWLNSRPAPDEILELLSCDCKRKCTPESCCCLRAGLKCTDMCKIECEHMISEDDNFDNDNDEEEEEDDINY